MKLIPPELAYMKASKAPITLTNDEKAVTLEKDDFRIVVTPTLILGEPKFAFNVRFSLDNTRGDFLTSRGLNYRLRTLLERNYNVENTHLETILKELNMSLLFTIDVLGSVNEFNSFSLVFKALNQCFEKLKVTSEDILIPLDSYKLRPSYTCVIVEKDKIIGMPTRAQTIGVVTLVIQEFNGRNKSVTVKSPQGLPIEFFLASF